MEDTRMGFDIPMNTKGCMSADSLLSLNGGSQPAPQPAPVAQPQITQPQMTQPQITQPQITQPVQPVMQPAPAPKQRPSGTGVHLKKGQKIALAQPGENLSVIEVRLGWDVTNGACDLDASAFMLGQDMKVIGDEWFVFYGQTVSPDTSITHSGDSDGSGVGDDEIITINVQKIDPRVQKIPFVVTINEALTQGLNFSMVANAYVRVVNAATNTEIAKFQLTDYYANVTSMVVGELYKHNGQWKFNAIGDGVAQDLAGLCAMYGVNVAD